MVCIPVISWSTAALHLQRQSWFRTKLRLPCRRRVPFRKIWFALCHGLKETKIAVTAFLKLMLNSNHDRFVVVTEARARNFRVDVWRKLYFFVRKSVNSKWKICRKCVTRNWQVAPGVTDLFSISRNMHRCASCTRTCQSNSKINYGILSITFCCYIYISSFIYLNIILKFHFMKHSFKYTKLLWFSVTELSTRRLVYLVIIVDFVHLSNKTATLQIVKIKLRARTVIGYDRSRSDNTECDICEILENF